MSRRPSKSNTRAKRQAKAKAARESRRETIATRAGERRLDELFGSELPPRRSAEIMLERLEGGAVPAGVSRLFALAGSVERAQDVSRAMSELAPDSVCSLTFAADVATQVELDEQHASDLLDRALTQTDDLDDRVRIAGQLTRLGRAADALAIVEELHADEPEDEDLQAIRAAALMVAYERVAAEPEDPDLPDECPCRSGQPWTECCQPKEEAALARFEDRGPLRTLRSAIDRYVTFGRDHRSAVADDVRRWLDAAQVTDEQLADPADLRRMAEEHAWLIGTEDNDPSPGQLFDPDSSLASFAGDPSTPSPQAAAARRWIEHHSYGLWQVRDPAARPGVWLTELVTGAKRYVAIPTEPLEPVGRWTVLLGGLVAVDGSWRPVSGMLPLRPREADEAVELVQELSYTVASSASGRKALRRDRRVGEPHGVLASVTEPSTPLVARFISMVIGSGMPQLLAFVAQLREQQPKMVNTDKDPLCLIKATVAVTDTTEVVAGLSEHPDFRIEDGTITWWGRELDALERETSRAELRAMLMERGETAELSEPDTPPRWLRGSLTLEADALEVDVNSRERLERLMAVLDEIGTSPTVVKQLVIDPAQDMALPRVGSAIGAVTSEEAEAAWRRHWPDQQLPALGGITPRRAARSERRKPWLEALLREMEHDADQLARRGRRATDVDSLRAELGMPVTAFV
ncbi:MAG: hypothetical protein ACRDMX_02300 [Solirubrobacteraceae bacterium]